MEMENEILIVGDFNGAMDTTMNRSPKIKMPGLPKVYLVHG